MDMSSLFPSEANATADLASSTDPLIHVSFKAGLLTLDNTTKQLTPDARQGTFQIRTSNDDGLVHIQWKPRPSTTADGEKDLILINSETEMKQVMSCPASARVYVLKWKESDTRLFLWMQEKNSDQDTTRVTLVNSILENGPTPLQTEEEEEEEEEEQPRTTPALPTNVPAPSAPATSIPTTIEAETPREAPIQPPQPQTTATPSSASTGAITLDQIRAALGGSGLQQQQQQNSLRSQQEALATTPTPRDVLQSENLQQALNDENFTSKLQSLFHHLPTEDRNIEDLKCVLRSHELETQAGSLGAALQSGQAAELLRSFGLLQNGQNSSSAVFGNKAFMDAILDIQRQHKKDNDDNNDTMND